MILYFIAIIICIVLIVCTYIFLAKYEKKNIAFYVDYSYIVKKTHTLLIINSVEDIKIRIGNNYSFVPNQNTIFIIDKEKYNNFDLFKCFHELGHVLDYKKNYPLISKLWLIDKQICIYSWMFILIWGVLDYVEIIESSLVCILIYTEMLLLIIHIILTIVFENRASRYAYHEMENKKYIICAIVSVFQQILFCCLLFFPLFCLILL